MTTGDGCEGVGDGVGDTLDGLGWPVLGFFIYVFTLLTETHEKPP